jgi:3',5'-cyclic AMP phosphodiesterase CpdA
MDIPITRRDALKNCSAMAATSAIAGLVRWAATHQQRPPKRGVLRIAHLTDIHVHPDGPSGRGLAACLRDVHALDRPDMILHGGDAIRDAFTAERAETQAQWQLWQKVLRRECRLPIEHCLGNHDIWGGAGGDGKQWALDIFGLSERYRSFDRAGWHFIVLDSIQPLGDRYEARLDNEQFAWLEADLKAVARTTPVLVLSHVPILCGCAFFDGDNEETGNWIVSGSWMHLDARRLKDLFYKHPNVRLCLSGHIHLRDRVDYNRVTYLCNGAVSGNWWRGAYQECEPGYGLIDLYDDGSFDHQYIAYG